MAGSSSEPLTSGRRHRENAVADLSLAEAGQVRIAWADGQMPVLRSIRARFERERPLEGMRVGEIERAFPQHDRFRCIGWL